MERIKSIFGVAVPPFVASVASRSESVNRDGKTKVVVLLRRW